MEEETVEFVMDGDQWCARQLPFTDLMTSRVGFGASKLEAFLELLQIQSKG